MSTLSTPRRHTAATTMTRRAAALATAGAAALAVMPATAVAADAAEPWVLVHTATGEQIDLTETLNDPAYNTVDIDAVLTDVAAELRATNSPVALTQPHLIEEHVTVVEIEDPTLGTVPVANNAAASTKGQAAVEAAKTMIGTPYVYGGTTPAGFDCSGFVQWAHAQAGTQLPRTSGAMAAAGTPVSRADMQPGDVIVYYAGASHVALYVGDGMMIDSLGSGYTVDYRPVDYMPIHSIVRFT